MKKLTLMIVVALLLPALSFAQSEYGHIYGTIMQTGGDAATGVSVTLTGNFGDLSKTTSEKGTFFFPALSPGTYRLVLKKSGFKSLILKDIRIFAGKNKKLQLVMTPGPADPPVIIAKTGGPIDLRRPVIATNITKDMLQSLPTARNIRSVIDLTPGLLVDRQDVGGNESGLMSTFFGLGAGPEHSSWHIDGVNISDPASIASAPAYLDTNSFEEIQVSTGANDIACQTGGIQLNFVTKKGGSRFSGGFHLYAADEALQMEQKLPASITGRGGGSPGILRLFQYGANLGGPIIKDKLWFFGSYAVQDIHGRTIAQTEDATWIAGQYGKIDFRFGNTSGYFKISQDMRRKWNVYSIGAAYQAPETAWTHTSPFDMLQGSIRREMGNLLLNAKITYMKNSFTSDPEANRLNANYIVNGQPGPDWYYYRSPSLYWTGSNKYYDTETGGLDLSLDGHYFLKGSKADHEIRFGVDYYTADTVSKEMHPNRRLLWVFDRGNPHGYKEIWWMQDYVFDAGFERVSFYVADTLSLSKLTVNTGLRYDKETGAHNPVDIPGIRCDGTPVFAYYMGDISLPGGTIDAGFEVFSPRLSLTYDMTGNGKNVVKVSYARYGAQSGNSQAAFNWTLYRREIDVYWNDLDGDLVPDVGEWDETPGAWIWWNIDAYDAFGAIANKFDPTYNSPVLNEITLSFEKALGEDFVVALNAFYKKESNLTWDRGMFSTPRTGAANGLTYNPGDLETAENWYKAYDYIFLDGTSKPGYERYYTPDRIYRTNHGSGTYNTYKALQVMVSKKLSHGWMLDASFTFSDWKRFYDPDEYFNKTNYDFFNGGAYAPLSGGSGLEGVYVNSRWQLKIAGLYRLPFGIDLTGVFRAREGYITAFYEWPWRSGGKEGFYETGKKFGDDRLPSFRMLNLGVEKTFRVSPAASVTLLVNAYNITNNAATLSVFPQVNSGHKGEALRILNPGIFQFGVRVDF